MRIDHRDKDGDGKFQSVRLIGSATTARSSSASESPCPVNILSGSTRTRKRSGFSRA